MGESLQLGILGCGNFATRRILPALQKISAISVVALQKRDVKEARHLAEKYNIPHAVSTRAELLNIPQIEAILIATPNHMHEEDALASAKHHKPVLCEKPLAPSSKAIIAMISAFKRQNLLLCVGQSLRFKFCLQKAKELLHSNKLGALQNIYAHFSVPLPQNSWKRLKAAGGGVLQDIGVHLIDLIRFISGQEIATIYASFNSGYQATSPEAEHTAYITCCLTNQTICKFECSFNQAFACGFKVTGSNASIISNHSLVQSDDLAETLCLIERNIKTYLPIPVSNIYADELLHFADTLQGEPSIIMAEEGLLNQKVIEAAYLSAQNGHSVQVR